MNNFATLRKKGSIRMKFLMLGQHLLRDRKNFLKQSRALIFLSSLIHNNIFVNLNKNHHRGGGDSGGFGGGGVLGPKSSRRTIFDLSANGLETFVFLPVTTTCSRPLSSAAFR